MWCDVADLRQGYAGAITNPASTTNNQIVAGDNANYLRSYTFGQHIFRGVPATLSVLADPRTVSITPVVNSNGKPMHAQQLGLR